jgi:hypothetical protein
VLLKAGLIAKSRAAETGRCPTVCSAECALSCRQRGPIALPLIDTQLSAIVAS